MITLEAQALAVLHAPAEMGLSADELAQAVEREPALAVRFVAAKQPITAGNIGAALAAYENATVSPANAPLDRCARGAASALPADERAGLDVFAGRGRCTRCHVPPLFGGTRPPDFSTTIYSVLGVPADAAGKTLDDDLGRAHHTHRAREARAFKTPTVRNSAATAPYFHNGVYATLAEVIDFYDKGGGRGLHLEVPNLDPDIVPLHLTAEEKRVLTIFVTQALRDGKTP